ncbi:MAG TPA: type VII secretion target [Pseudonocardiaceae bacterium]|jgi:hypothetical protein
MTEAFTLYPADLLAHANTLDDQAARIGTASSAAEQATPNAESFGQICQFFAVGAMDQVRTAAQCLAGLHDAVGQLAGGVRDTAEVYARADAANCAIFEGVQ